MKRRATRSAIITASPPVFAKKMRSPPGSRRQISVPSAISSLVGAKYAVPFASLRRGGRGHARIAVPERKRRGVEPEIQQLPAVDIPELTAAAAGDVGGIGAPVHTLPRRTAREDVPRLPRQMR